VLWEDWGLRFPEEETDWETYFILREGWMR
jgi:hypothetical protein